MYEGNVNSHSRIQLGTDPSETFVLSGWLLIALFMGFVNWRIVLPFMFCVCVCVWWNLQGWDFRLLFLECSRTSFPPWSLSSLIDKLVNFSQVVRIVICGFGISNLETCCFRTSSLLRFPQCYVASPWIFVKSSLLKVCDVFLSYIGLYSLSESFYLGYVSLGMESSNSLIFLKMLTIEWTVSV